MSGIRGIRFKRLAHYVMASIWIILFGILAIVPAIWSAVSAETRISSSGAIIANIAYAKSGSAKDIQTAVDAVVDAGGGTVYIPEGNFTFEPQDTGRTASNGKQCGVKFVVPTDGITIKGMGVNTTILQMPIDDDSPNVVMFDIIGGHETSRTVGGWVSHGKVRITGITFKGRNNPNVAQADVLVWLECCKDFRVDNCSFYYAGGTSIWICDHYLQNGITDGDPARVSQGVVDHCQFLDAYKTALGETGGGYGVQINRALHYLWTVWNDDSSSLVGIYDKNVFIEDCYFRGIRHAVASSSGGVYVLRYCTIEDELIAEAATTGHPVRIYSGDPSSATYGCRYSEFYNNTIQYTGTYGVKFHGIHIEGGGALVYNNTITNLIHGVRIGNCEGIAVFYPKGTTHDIYIWSNTFTGCDVNVYTFNNGMGQPDPTLGIDYFLNAPPSDWNYQPYPYPHPLTA